VLDNNTITNNNFNKMLYWFVYFLVLPILPDNNVISNNNFGSNTSGLTYHFEPMNLSAVTTSTIQPKSNFNMKIGPTNRV
jgi:hypothetical protein